MHAAGAGSDTIRGPGRHPPPVPHVPRRVVPTSPLLLPDPPPANERGEVVRAAGHGRAPGVAADFVLVLAIDLGRILLVRNARRQVLELPGGWVDPGETPRQAAARELLEETGHVAGSMEILGWLQLGSPGTVDPLTGLVFGAQRLRRRRPHAQDEEIESLHWARLPALPPALSGIDAWLVVQFAGGWKGKGTP